MNTTTQVTVLNRNNIGALRADIDAALAAVGAKWGMQIKSGACRFSDKAAQFKVEAAVIGEGGEACTKELNDLKVILRRMGISEEKGLAEIRMGFPTKPYKLVGYRSKQFKYPFIAKDLTDGKLYKFSSNSVRLALGLPISSF